MITVERVTKTYGATAVLREVSLSVRPGETTTLIGDNGSGKTTLMRILAGLVRADQGTAMLDGVEIGTHRRQAQRRVSFLPQHVRFHPSLSGRDVLRFYSDLRGLTGGSSGEQIERSLGEWGLEDVADRPTGQLSGGTLQRLGLALTLLPDAPILLLDEPGVSLDPAWRAQMQTRLVAEARRGKTVLITTHLLAEWEAVTDRCLRCRSGRIAPAQVGERSLARAEEIAR